jgi:hypothetical protein
VSKLKDKTPAYWYGDARPPFHARLLASLYGAVVALRAKLFRAGVLRSRSAAVPVIVVGNVSVGGTGKTPLTIALVQRLQKEGWTPGVASRGYGRRDEATPAWVSSGTLPAEGISPFPANSIMARELDYVGAFRAAHAFDWAVQYLRTRRVDVRPLLSAQIPLSRSLEAFELASDRSRSTKVQVVCD